MALEQKTLADVKAEIIADFELQFGNPVPLLSKAVWRIVATVMAGVYIILYEYGFDAMKQRFIQTANETYVKIIGRTLGLTPLNPSTWEGEITVVSTAYTGSLTANTQFVNKNTGFVYAVIAVTSLSVGSNTVAIRSLVSGADKNLADSTILDFVSAIPGVSKTVTVSDTISQGDDAETLESFRARVLQRYRSKPQGGALIDYVIWLSEAPNILNSYPYATIGTPGQVDIHIEVDNQTDGIPTSSQLTEYYDNYINVDPDTGIANRRPVTAEINMLPITRREEDVQVVALDPDNSEIRAAIESAMETVLLAKEPYIEGVTINRNDFIKKSQLNTAIQNVTDSFAATFDDIVLSNSGIPYSSDVLAKGQKTKLGAVTYTT